MRARSAFVVAAVAVLAIAAVAEARPGSTNVRNFKAEQLSPGTVLYSGKVASNKARCAKNRKYEIIHNGVVIASGKTDDDGKFTAIGPEPPDGDKVKVKIKSKRGL